MLNLNCSRSVWSVKGLFRLWCGNFLYKSLLSPLRFSLNMFFVFIVTCPFTNLHSTEFKPWFGEVLVVETNVTGFFEYYPSIASSHGNRHQSTSDGFLELEASIAYDETIAFELEVVAGGYPRNRYGFDSITLTGRERFLNDIVDDPVSLSMGLSITQVFDPGLHNLSAPFFYHGGIEGELDVAVGKEFSCEQFWVSRIWGVLGVGLADLGSAWIRANIDWEYNWWDNQEVHLFAHSLWGTGGNALNPDDFHGYGPINHQSVDLGVGYRYYFQRGIALGLDYNYRVFAQNCPRGASLVTLDFFYAF